MAQKCNNPMYKSFLPAMIVTIHKAWSSNQTTGAGSIQKGSGQISSLDKRVTAQRPLTIFTFV